MVRKSVIVVDTGSYSCKSGFSNSGQPQSVISTVVGRPSSGTGFDTKDGFIGTDVQARRAFLQLSYPISRGVIRNWDDAEELWRYIFNNELDADVSQHDVLMPVAPNCPNNNRSKIAEIVMETFNANGVAFSIPGMLAMFANPKVTNMLVEFGDSNIHIVPMWRGYVMTKHMTLTRYSQHDHGIAGGDLTNYLATCLLQKGYAKISEDREIVGDIKHKMCLLSKKYDVDERCLPTIPYTLPGVRDIIDIDNERIKCPEVIFRPQRFNFFTKSIQEMIIESINQCPIDTQGNLRRNVVLSGSGWMFKGFIQRLQQELSAASNGMAYTVTPSFNAAYAAWTGGATFANMPFFEDILLSRKDYEERGVRRLPPLLPE